MRNYPVRVVKGHIFWQVAVFYNGQWGKSRCLYVTRAEAREAAKWYKLNGF